MWPVGLFVTLCVLSPPSQLQPHWPPAAPPSQHPSSWLCPTPPRCTKHNWSSAWTPSAPPLRLHPGPRLGLPPCVPLGPRPPISLPSAAVRVSVLGSRSSALKGAALLVKGTRHICQCRHHEVGSSHFEHWLLPQGNEEKLWVQEPKDLVFSETLLPQWWSGLKKVSVAEGHLESEMY
jgi:hypothetical protein